MYLVGCFHINQKGTEVNKETNNKQRETQIN